MAELLSVSTALPEYSATAAETKAYLSSLLPPHAAARFARLVDASGNQRRHGVLPLDELRRLGTVAERNQAYLRHAVRLGEVVARDALARAALDSGSITAVIGVSSTGHLMPTLETHLINRLGLSSRCRRVPLTQLGCAGGVAGLGLAAELTRGAAHTVLVVCVELPSLTLPLAEPTPTEILASTQLGDGAAAAVVRSGASGRGPEVLASGGVLFPGTIERNGVQLTSAGFRMAPPRGLAQLLRENLAEVVDRFLTEQGVGRRDIGFWVVHPRNADLLAAAADSLRLSEAQVAAPRTVWERCGNMVSAAVFHGLRQLHADTPPADGSLGLLVAYGTGFSCELALLRSAGWLAAS